MSSPDLEDAARGRTIQSAVSRTCSYRPSRGKLLGWMAEKTDYDLTEAEAALLMAATRDAMAAAGALGAALADQSFSRGLSARGGAAGGRFGARFTKPLTAAATVEVALDPEVVRERARTNIADTGVVVEDPNTAGDGSVWGVVGSGALDMSPALVRVGVEPVSGGSRVHVRGTGREGLIKQKIGSKAVDRLCDAIAARAH